MTSKCRYVVMTTSGKPVFVYPPSQDENDTTRLCALVQALRVTIQQSLHEELHSLGSGQSMIIWMTIRSFTWMVITTNDSQLPVAYWRGQLERMYAAIIMIFTTQIQTMLTQNPHFNVEMLWCDQQVHHERFFNSFLDHQQQQFSPWGISPCFLSSPTWRRQLTSCIVQVSHDTIKPWMAFFVLRQPMDQQQYRLITYAASHSFSSFTSSDGVLFWNWLSQQQQQQDYNNDDTAVLLPICFPHFHAEGYLYASLHSMLDFTLVLLYPNEDVNPNRFVEQFWNQVCTILPPHYSVPNPLKQHRQHDENDTVSLEQQFMEEFRWNQQEESWLWEDYFELSKAWHILFRMHTCCTQIIVSPSNHYNTNPEEMWYIYHQLFWQLRLGSVSMESTLKHVMEGSSSFSSEQQQTNINPTIAIDCPLLKCMDTPPSVQGVTYITKGETTYLAMSGQDFELYLATNSSILPEEVAALAAKLTRRILSDQSKWFLSKPLTFSS